MHILIIDDEPIALAGVIVALERQHYQIRVVSNPWMGLELLVPLAATQPNAQPYDMILLNARLAQLDGTHLCRQLRAQGYLQPILLLVEDASTDGVAGLNAGADDYVMKPYQVPEILARIEVLRRRQEATAPTLLCWGDLCMNMTAAEVTFQGKPLALTPKESALLALFLENPQRVFSRTAILDRLWGFDAMPSESTVTNHIKELRQKLRAGGLTVDLIETVYGLGYRLKPPPKQDGTGEEHPPMAMTGTLPSPLQPPVATEALRVLVVDEDPAILSALHYLLQPWGLEVTALPQPSQFWETLNRVQPELLILNWDLSQVRGADLCHQVRQDGRWGDLPILVMMAEMAAEAVQEAFAAGADDYVMKPIVGPELVTRVVSRLERKRSLSAPSTSRPLSPESAIAPPPLLPIQPTYGNILLVDDQPENLRILSKILDGQGYKVRKALNGATALEAIRSQPADVIVLDVRMPEMNGYEVCATLKAQPETRDIPILFLSALDATADKLKAFAVGGMDYITKPFHDEEVLARIKHQLVILQQRRQLAERNRQLHQEIQERQQAMVSFQQMQAALQEKEALFRALFEEGAIALALIDRGDRWLQVNPVCCALLGYSAAELRKMPVSTCLQGDGFTLDDLFQDQGVHALMWHLVPKASSPCQVQVRSWLIGPDSGSYALIQVEPALSSP